MIVRRGAYFVVMSADGLRELKKFGTRQSAEGEHSTLLAGDSTNGRPANSTHLQRDFIVLKQRAPTLAAAASLVRKHGGKVRGHRQTADSWRFKQAERDLFVDGSHYTEELEAGVFVVLATPLEDTAYSLMESANVEASQLIGMFTQEVRPSAFGGAFAYDQSGVLVNDIGSTLEQACFPCEPYGRAQFLRTGSGFWRKDHGEPFAIDKNLLKMIFKNTQIRGRDLRCDYMHWTDQDSQHAEQFVPAGWARPCDLYIAKFTDQLTRQPEFGIFGPVAWEDKGAVLIQRGLNQISPVIDWQYTLRHDTPTHPAGTYLGPTITKFALVDEGFFWMEAIRLYKDNESAAPSFLYREGYLL
jgi:hypothetical protein